MRDRDGLDRRKWQTAVRFAVKLRIGGDGDASEEGIDELVEQLETDIVGTIEMG